MFNEPLVIYRDKNNRPRCIKDSCPHRSASFRGGENQNGEIVCPYHGARYTTSCNQDGSDRITCNHIIDSHYENFAKHTEEGTKLFTFLISCWALYGLAATRNDITKNTMYNCLDVVSKNFYGLFIFYQITQIGHKP